MFTLLLCLPLALCAQTPQPANPQTPPAEKKNKEYTISVDVNEVVLHATVIDKKGRIVNDLKQDDFRVYEDGAPQTLTHFSHADVPVTMGIVIDDSGSMRDKRQAVNAAALIFAKTSNPQDQVFVVNFNDVYYLDTPGDFATTIEDLKSALDKIDSRGGTALRDAVIASLDHLKLGNRDKKVLAGDYRWRGQCQPLYPGRTDEQRPRSPTPSFIPSACWARTKPATSSKSAAAKPIAPPKS